MKNIKLLYFDTVIPELLANSGKPVGGAATEWLNWLKAFNALSVNSAILTWKGAKSYIGMNSEFEIIETFNKNTRISKLRVFYNYIPSLYSAIRKEKNSIIVMEAMVDWSWVLLICAKVLKRKFVYRIASNMDVDGRIEKNFSYIVIKGFYFTLKNANHISCQNKYQYEILKKKYPNKSISILYNPYFFRESIIRSKSERKYIAWVGNFRYEKNLPAFAQIVKNFPNIKFRIAGTRFAKTDEDAAKGLEALEQLKNVEFLGHINNSEVTELLGGALCLLNTSRLEGFSNTFLEAWSVGTPVVTTTNVNPDGIVDKFNVGLVAENYILMENKIDELINLSENDFNLLSQNCVNYVKAHHDPIKLAKQFLNDILNSK